MYFLPLEVQLDICKCLNFSQLLSVQQTNIYFKNFIGEYKGKLARKKFDYLTFISENSLYEFVKPDPKLYEFELSEHLEEKWKCAIEKSIPMFFCDDFRNVDISGFELWDRNNVDSSDGNCTRAGRDLKINCKVRNCAKKCEICEISPALISYNRSFNQNFI
uniref:F-box domain-containing protein n=1 Tax=Meloidogyne incognita TaxID=6306 RepID=A0A914KYP4_MELIC